MKNKSLYQAGEQFKLSRSKIDLYCLCPCCFYLDRKLGITPPPGFPFNLNNAVDALLKKEFDSYRAEGSPHPLMIDNSINAIPFQHEQLNDWRSNRRGVQFLHPETNFLVYGALDDVWINSEGELIVVDYKATSKNSEVSIDADWQIGYKRQMEVYQWLLRKNGFKVSSTGYFVYCNGKKDRPAFNARLDFDIHLFHYEGNDSWIESTLQNIFTCLSSESIPNSSPCCDLCNYRKSVSQLAVEAPLPVDDLKA